MNNHRRQLVVNIVYLKKHSDFIRVYCAKLVAKTSGRFVSSLRRSDKFGGTHALDGGAHVTKGSSPPAVVEYEHLTYFSSNASLYYSCVIFS